MIKICVKVRLHIDELAQRTASVWRYIAFVDIRWYTLEFVSSSILGAFSVRRRTLAYVVVRIVRRRFLCMHKLFSTYVDEWPIRRGFVHRTQLVRYVRPQYGNGSVTIRWLTSNKIVVTP